MARVIAIDGPAASGKGTLARRVAGHYGFHHLDTGLTYRAVAHRLLVAGAPLDDEASVLSAARQMVAEDLAAPQLSSHRIGEAASRIAVIPALRSLLVEFQRRFAEMEPGAVLDGRDIGTVVCPHADVKLFVTADAQVRARRRFDEIISRGGNARPEDILADILRRDERDASRADSPMRPARDAHLIDTSTMDIETAFRAAVAIIDSHPGF